MSVESHQREGATRVRFAVLSISDTRDASTDRGGPTLVAGVERAGHTVTLRALCRDEPDEITRHVREAVAHPDVDLVLATGGTGIAPRDVTFPTLERLYESTIPGFGELFRFLSFRDIGSAALLSRASAGLIGGKVVLSLPGSPKALELALSEIILKEAGHLVSQARGPA